MARVLRGEDGRELVLADGCLVKANVLLVDGEPLVRLEDPLRVPPLLMDTIAASVPGSSIREAGDGVDGAQA